MMHFVSYLRLPFSTVLFPLNPDIAIDLFYVGERPICCLLSGTLCEKEIHIRRA